MIVFRTEVRDGVSVVEVGGAFEGDDAPSLLVEHLRRSTCGNPLVVDLTWVGRIERQAVPELVRGLEAVLAQHGTVLLHQDLASRRMLRSMSATLPVVPDVEQAHRGRFLCPQPMVTVG